MNTTIDMRVANAEMFITLNGTQYRLVPTQATRSEPKLAPLRRRGRPAAKTPDLAPKRRGRPPKQSS